MGSTEPQVAKAVEALLRGELVVIPTDTVYGVAALASDDGAVARLYAAKGRGAAKALPVLVASLEKGERVGLFNHSARRLAKAFWPGPLTIVLPVTPSFHSAALGGGNTVGLRMPDQPLALQVIEAAGGLLAVTSANRSGDADPLTVEDARRQLGDAVAVYLDGGRSRGGKASTVVAVLNERAEIERAGPISESQIRSVS
jgi:L-threonylcarbamoyladenylate synthase